MVTWISKIMFFHLNRLVNSIIGHGYKIIILTSVKATSKITLTYIHIHTYAIDVCLNSLRQFVCDISYILVFSTVRLNDRDCP